MKFRKGLRSPLKGPRFPSFDNQQTPKPRTQWIHHTGKRARLRNLRHVCRPILDNPCNAEMIQRIRDKIPAGPFTEYGVLMIIFQAKEVADSTGISWLESADYTLEHLQMESKVVKSEAAVEPQLTDGETANA